MLLRMLLNVALMVVLLSSSQICLPQQQLPAQAQSQYDQGPQSIPQTDSSLGSSSWQSPGGASSYDANSTGSGSGSGQGLPESMPSEAPAYGSGDNTPSYSQVPQGTQQNSQLGTSDWQTPNSSPVQQGYVPAPNTVNSQRAQNPYDYSEDQNSYNYNNQGESSPNLQGQATQYGQSAQQSNIVPKQSSGSGMATLGKVLGGAASMVGPALGMMMMNRAYKNSYSRYGYGVPYGYGSSGLGSLFGGTSSPYGYGAYSSPYGSGGYNPYGYGGYNSPYGYGGYNPYGYSGYNSPYGYGGYNPSGYGGYGSPYGSGGYGSSFGGLGGFGSLLRGF